MVFRKRIALIALFLIVMMTDLFGVVFPVPTVTPLSKRSLHVRVITNKSMYKVLQPILLTYWVENLSETPQYIGQYDRIAPVVFDAGGTPIDNCSQLVSEARLQAVDNHGRVLANYTVIPPLSQTRKVEYDVLLGGGWARSRCDGLKSGWYYATSTDLPSDTAWFEIKLPVDSEELGALRAYDEAMSESAACREVNTYSGPLICNIFARAIQLSQMLNADREIYFSQRVYHSLLQSADLILSVLPDSLPVLAAAGTCKLAAEYIYLFPYSPFAHLTIRLLVPSALTMVEQRLALEGLRHYAEMMKEREYVRNRALEAAERIEDYLQQVP